MGSCYNVRKYFSDYLENKLEPESRVLVDNHLKDCSACVRSLKTISHLKSQLSTLPRYKCSDEFTQKLRKRIYTTKRNYTQSFPLRKYSYAFAAVLVIFLSIYSVQWIYDKPEEKAIPSSTVISPVDSDNQVNTYSNQHDINIKTKASIAGQDDSLETRENSNGRIKYVDQQ